MTTQVDLLQFELYIRRRASATQGSPPGKDNLKWVANTATLVYGRRDALLVDTFLCPDYNDIKYVLTKRGCG